MKCKDVKEQLIEYLDDSLDDARRRDVEEHLLSCEDCLKEHDELLASCKMLADYQAPVVNDQFTRQVLQKVHDQKQIPAVSGVFERLVAWFSLKSLPALASLAILVGLGYFIFVGNPVKNGLSGPKQVKIVRDLADEEIIRNLEIYENADLLENLDLLVDLEAVENYEADK